MAITTQTYRLDIVPCGAPLIVNASQYDYTDRSLTFEVYSRLQAGFSLPASTKATVNGTKPDGKAFSYSCSVSGNKVSCDLKEQMTAVAGDTICGLSLAYNGIVTTANFILRVEPSPYEKASISDTEFKAVEDMIGQAASSASAAASSQSAAASSASSAKTSASNASSSASAASGSATSAANSASAASGSASAASASEKNASSSASAAATSASNASTSASNASKSASAASGSQTAAANSASAAAGSATAAKNSADTAQSYAEQAAKTSNGISAYISKADGMLHYKYNLLEV